MSRSRFAELSPREQALVAVATLIDGAEAAAVLGLDSERGEVLKAAATELSSFELDARLPFVGTLLRRALEDIEGA